MNVLSLFKPIKLIAMDVDGVLTNGSLLLLQDGQMARTMNIKDGYALQLAVKKGYEVVVISGAEDAAVKNRLQKLGITQIHLGVTDKSSLLKELMTERQLDASQVLFIGDDMPDYTVMQWVGLACCPSDAVSDIVQISSYISAAKGGEGCVREVIEKVLRLNNDWGLDVSIAAK